MNKIKLYYIIKPVIPRKLQLIMRRKYAAVQVVQHSKTWPILETAAKPPVGWNGWPENKEFALVLTHDVETQKGHDRCIQLLEVEKNLNFRSSFNFVPEGYSVSEKLRKYITANGFEVGVHGLNHDGKLFKDKKTFDERAVKINNYIKSWDARGFRAPAMHHNLEWISQLNIDYDLSTFDTDPFEPQSDGVSTIFPFIYTGKDNDSSYVEIPYTLVQDFTLFIILNHKNIEIWKKKVDWIVSKGGMVLVNVHPDYINFLSGKNNFDEYSVNLYSEFLLFIKEKYSGKYWNALPSEVADFVKSNS
jgi:hypothetical protein